MTVGIALVPPSQLDIPPTLWAVGGCCMGEVLHGPGGCTCWEPIYDLEQQDLDLASEPSTRAKCCHDCAYRNGSPEDGDGLRGDLVTMAMVGANEAGDRTEFWCHQGARRAVAYRHPDGRIMEAGPGDYQPPQGPNADGVECVWLADGGAGERCAGWAAIRAGSTL